MRKYLKLHNYIINPVKSTVIRINEKIVEIPFKDTQDKVSKDWKKISRRKIVKSFGEIIWNYRVIILIYLISKIIKENPFFDEIENRFRKLIDFLEFSHHFSWLLLNICFRLEEVFDKI